MKKILSLILALSLLAMLCACGGGGDNPSSNPENSQSGGTQSETPNENPGTESTTPDTPPDDGGDDIPSVDPGKGGPTDLYYISEVTDLEGTWKLAKVLVGGETTDAADGAMTFKVTLELDPSELVDGPAYIHNQVYNLSGLITFGLDSITSQLEAEDIESYKGTTSWEDFPQGKVMAEGTFYHQPGPATMSFRDIDVLGLFLDEIAGVGGDVDTTNKKLIIGMNADGQLLLGYSTEHIERPGTDGEWEYLLVFDK